MLPVAPLKVKLHPSRRGICPLYEDIANIADSPGPFLAGVFFHCEKFPQHLVPLGGLPGVAVDLRLLRFASKPFFFFFFKVECLRGGSGKWGKHCLSNYG